MKDSGVLKHFNFANIYQKSHVCGFCKAMYDKIDHLRGESNNEKNEYLASLESIPDAIDKYLSDMDNKFKNIVHIETKVFSEKFFYELQFFDLPRPEPENPRLQKELLPDFYCRQLRRKEQVMQMYIQQQAKLMESPTDFRLRKVNEISLKMHLGAKEKVPVNKVGAITTPSSLKLANLQSV